MADQQFPPGVAEQFEDLTNQVINLHQKWRFYLDLFDNKDAEEVMNDRLFGSFRIIEECVRHDLIITLYRLADVAETHGGRRTNLTLRSLLDQVRDHAFEEFFDDCQGQRTGFTGLYTEATLGLTYKPTKSLWLRPEVRYDYNTDARPFEDKHGLFTATFDVIVRW